MPGECAECNGPAAVHGWAPVELCFPCVIELRGRPTQADLAAAEQAATVTRDAQWREAVSEELHDIGATQIHSASLLELFEGSAPESHVEAGASRGETAIRIPRASRGSGTSMNEDPKGLMAEQRERLGPLCTHFRYASRCEECGAPPMKAQTDPPPDKPAADRSADSAATAQDAQVEAAARALWKIGNDRIGHREWEAVKEHYLAEARAALEAAAAIASLDRAIAGEKGEG